MKVRECCCGFPLRTGTLILVWTGTVLFCLSVLIYLSMALRLKQGYTSGDTIQTVMIFYYLLYSIVGLFCSILGIVGINKNKKKFVLPFYYICVFYTLFTLLTALLLICSPQLYFRAILLQVPTPDIVNGIPLSTMVTMVLCILFTCALFTYFVVVVKSYVQIMETDSGSYGMSPPSAPDPAAIGYRAA